MVYTYYTVCVSVFVYMRDDNNDDDDDTASLNSPRKLCLPNNNPA